MTALFISKKFDFDALLSPIEETFRCIPVKFTNNADYHAKFLPAQEEIRNEAFIIHSSDDRNFNLNLHK